LVGACAPALAGQLAAVAGFGLAAGIVLEFFLDPRSGTRRRNLARDRTKGALRRRKRVIERHAHYEAGKAVGLAHAITHHDHGAEMDDVGLVRKVESELFRDRAIPKGQISINADRGIVVLRGQLDDPKQILQIEQRVRKIGGVREVENLLHPSSAPAPASHPHGNPRSMPAQE
jgi:hyperosmotically inducible periplasmic protein